MNDNLPPGCSVNDIPGNRKEDIEFERAFDQALDIIRAAVPRLLRSEGPSDISGRYVVRPGLLTDDQADKLAECIAFALIEAREDGINAGQFLGFEETA